MNVAALAYALAAAAYAGFQLTVRVVVYPQFARVPQGAFAAYELAHQRLVTPLVGVLFGGLALGTAAMLVAGPRPGAAPAAALLAALLAITAFGAVPQHRRLELGFDPGAHRTLLRFDTARVVLALAQAALGVAAVLATDR